MLRNLKRYLIAASSSLLLICISYFYNNLPLFTGEKLPCFALAEWVRSGISPSHEQDSILYINAAYDRQLTTYREDGMVLGNTDISDRYKLLQLLKLLEQTDYRYIFMDIRFEKGCESDDPTIDSLLFAKIKAMPRIVLVRHRDVENMAGVPMEKMAYNDYYSTITATNFIRYQYRMRGEMTMPLYAYRELTGNTIERHCLLFHTSGHHLCHNSVFLTFAPEDKRHNYVDILGKDILQSDAPLANIKRMANGKMVVIGDFVHDMHDTYSGLHAGPKLIASGLLALMAHRHYVNWWLALILFLLYFALTFGMYTDKRWYEYIPFLQKVRFPVMLFALSFLGFTATLYTFSFLLGLCFRIYISFWLPSIWLTLLSSYISYKHHRHEPLDF